MLRQAQIFLGTTNSQALIVKTNNVERYRVTGNGALGINEDNPTQKLEVAGNILVKTDGTGTGELRLQEPSSNMGNNYTGFKAGNLPNNIIYTLPTSQPLDGQVLSSNTQGILTWTTPGGATGTAGGDLTGTYPNPTIANNVVDGTKIALGSDANGDMMYYNGTDYVRLPISTDGQVFTIILGIPSWQVVSLPNFSSLRFTSAPNATIPVHQFAATGTEISIDIALTPKGTGALTAQVADNTSTGGNKRGQHTVDWQRFRSANTEVASGDFSIIFLAVREIQLRDMVRV